jgi:hypothetical protein
MSLLTLLIVASLVAAVAFFLAGLLLAPRRAPAEVARDEAGQADALTAEIASLRRACAASEAARAEANQQCQAAQAERKREQEQRAAAEQERDGARKAGERLQAVERERDGARKEVERLQAKEKTLAERLRVAENEFRAAFEREEKVAEAWAGQLDAAKAGQKQHETLVHEVEELRAKLASERAERERLAAEAQASAAKAEVAAAALEELREEARQQAGRLAAEAESARRELAAATQAAVAHEQQARQRLAEVEAAARSKLAEAESAWRAAAASAEVAWQAKATTSEVAWQAKLAETESAWRSKLAAAESAAPAPATTSDEGLRAKLTAAAAERAQLAEELGRAQVERKAGEEARETLSLRVLAAEEVAEQRRVEAVAAVESLRSAEARLKDYERMAQENSELREQQAQTEREAKQLASREEETKDVKVELAAAQAKLAELERIVDENRRLRDEAAELRAHQEASGELEKLQAAHKQVRLDAELMARRLQELLHDQAELAPLRAQAAETAALAAEVEYLRRREKDLEAQLYASGSYSSRELPAVSGELPVVAPSSDLETNLSALVGEGGPRTAVLADVQGFLIASAGESVAEDGLAAFAAVASDLVARARALLPLADVNSVRVTDANRMVLDCHLFASAGESLGVATLGPGEAKAEDTKRAIAGLSAIVGGADGGKGEDPEPGT